MSVENIRDNWLDPPANDYIYCSGCNCRVDSTDCEEVIHDIFLCPDCYEEWVEDNEPKEEEEDDDSVDA